MNTPAPADVAAMRRLLALGDPNDHMYADGLLMDGADLCIHPMDGVGLSLADMDDGEVLENWAASPYYHHDPVIDMVTTARNPSGHDYCHCGNTLQNRVIHTRCWACPECGWYRDGHQHDHDVCIGQVWKMGDGTGLTVENGVLMLDSKALMGTDVCDDCGRDTNQMPHDPTVEH